MDTVTINSRYVINYENDLRNKVEELIDEEVEKVVGRIGHTEGVDPIKTKESRQKINRLASKLHKIKILSENCNYEV